MNENMERKRPEARFLCSAAFFKDLPKPSGYEFAMLGRSNVGKSSFINHVLENRSLARISKTPGKTSLANFYQVDSEMVWVDLPGYGYAKTSGDEKIRWSKLIASYCENRNNLLGIIFLIDIRHIGLKADVEAYQWICSLKKPFFPVLTKADKLTAAQVKKQISTAKEIFNLSEEPVLYSVNDHKSRERFWSQFLLWKKMLIED